MMEVPPGVTYLCLAAPSLLAPSAIVYGVLRFVQPFILLTIPSWTMVIAVILARPTLMIAMKIYTSLSIRREVAARGAVLLPHVPDAPWGLATMRALVKSFKYGYPGDVFLEWSEQVGSAFTINSIGETRIFTTEPEHVKMMLATQFNNFEKGSVSRSFLGSLLGTGVFNSDGDMWKFHRTITRPYFTKDRISDFDIFHEHADDAIKQAKERLAQNIPIDFQDMISRFTLDSATTFLFGHNVRSLSAGLIYPESHHLAQSSEFVNHPSNVFANAFGTAQDISGLRSRYGSKWALVEFWKDKIKPHRDIIDQLVEPIMEEAFAQKKEANMAAKNGLDEEKEGTLLEHLVRQTDDKTVVKDELVNLLVAGRDTTAATLTLSVYMLAEHPEIARRLREEILNRVGISNTPTYDDMREMKYLRAFINEILRLYPPVPFDGRTSKEATVWPSKTPGVKPAYIAPNTRCFYSVLLMHRRTDLWGPDALEFDPDRFLDDRSRKYLVPNPFIFLPFNAGPRICLGQQFAYHETSFFLVRLLQTFNKFSLALDTQPAWSKPPASWAGSKGLKGKDKVCFGLHLTMYVKGGLWVRMEEAPKDEDRPTK